MSGRFIRRRWYIVGRIYQDGTCYEYYATFAFLQRHFSYLDHIGFAIHAVQEELERHRLDPKKIRWQVYAMP